MGNDDGGDAEQIHVQLNAVPDSVDCVTFAVSIYDAESRGQSFGRVRDAHIRIVDDDSGVELARYDLTQTSGTETAMLFGELYRRGRLWKFRAIGQGYSNGLAGIAEDFGVDV